MSLTFDPTRDRQLSLLETTTRLRITVPEFARLITRGKFPPATCATPNGATWSDRVVSEWLAKNR